METIDELLAYTKERHSIRISHSKRYTNVRLKRLSKKTLCNMIAYHKSTNDSLLSVLQKELFYRNLLKQLPVK